MPPWWARCTKLCISKKSLLPFLLLLEGVAFSAPLYPPPIGLVNVPVADLRSSSGPVIQNLEYDPLLETQLLYNEPVEILEEWGDGFRVEAPQQKEFTHKKSWQGYPGWILKSAVKRVKKILPPNLVIKNQIGTLRKNPSSESPGIELSMGTQLFSEPGKEKNGFFKIKTPSGGIAWINQYEVNLMNVLSQNSARRIILKSGENLLDRPYFWGGRSQKSVDCSGLVNLAYRVAGMEIPRDSHEQYLAARKIKKDELKPGDLIFSASQENPEKVTHVAIFVDSTTVLEAPKTGQTVRKIEFDKKYGPDSILHFGTFFDSQD